MLSHRQIKEAGRVGGIEWMLPYAAALGMPANMDPDTESRLGVAAAVRVHQ